jgi:hypothetical protein
MQGNSQVHAEYEYLTYPVSCPVSLALAGFERRRGQSPHTTEVAGTEAHSGSGQPGNQVI